MPQSPTKKKKDTPVVDRTMYVQFNKMFKQATGNICRARKVDKLSQSPVALITKIL